MPWPFEGVATELGRASSRGVTTGGRSTVAHVVRTSSTRTGLPSRQETVQAAAVQLAASPSATMQGDAGAPATTVVTPPALSDRGIPVVTLFTDVPLSRRVAYVGIGNLAAGATAAYLLTRWSPHGGTVLVTVSSSAFRGEDEREIGFRATMRQMAPERAVREVTDTNGADPAILEAVTTVLEEDSTIDAVYSVGGGNAATALAFARRTKGLRLRRPRPRRRQPGPAAPAAHLGRAPPRPARGHASHLPLGHAGSWCTPGSSHSLPSHVQVITPFNEPRAFARSA